MFTVSIWYRKDLLDNYESLLIDRYEVDMIEQVDIVPSGNNPIIRVLNSSGDAVAVYYGQDVQLRITKKNK